MADHELDHNLFKFQKNEIFAFSLSVPSQLILKYVYALDILIHVIVHMKYFNSTLPVLQKL